MMDIFLSAHANSTPFEHTVLSVAPVSPLLRYVVRRRLGIVPVEETSIAMIVVLTMDSVSLRRTA